MLSIDLLNITKKFMQDGYFSEYLPPSFSLSKNKNIISLFDGSIALSSKCDLAAPISFTMSRFKEDGSRRTIFIPELCSYIASVKLMQEKNLISDLISISESPVSFSPIIQATGELTRHERDYTETVPLDSEEVSLTYVPNVLKKLNLAKGAEGILYLDISNFYGSIYTHLIPAIKLGYEEAENQYKAQKANNLDPIICDDYRDYVSLDKSVRNMNCARTNGLLTGTMISQFLAEALLSRIDKELQGEGIKYVRYVDDYEIFIYDERQTVKLKNSIENILKKYFLSINDEKTRYVKFPYYMVENLKKIYSDYTKHNLSDEELMKLFNTFYNMEQDGVKGAIRFLIKSINSDLKFRSKELFTTYLVNTLVNDSRSLIKTYELLITNKNKTSIQKQDIQIVKNLLEQHLDKGNDLEVIWLLYLLKHLNVKKLNAQLARKIIYSSNELAIVVLLEEYKSTVTEKMKNECKTRAKSWLLCYQMFLRGYITKAEFLEKANIKHNTDFYAILKRKDFSFYHS